MRFWLAKLLRRADGPTLTTCPSCETVFSRVAGERVGSDLVCSPACAELHAAQIAW